MASVIQICNMALSRVGNSNPIASLTEASTQARQCNTHYEQCRDEVIQAFPWGFASKRVALALIDEELVTNWTYCYAYPSDCLRVFSIVAAGLRNPTLAQSVQYEVANYLDAKVILTDEPDAEVFYASRVTDPALFPPLVVKSIAALMASRIALPITGKPMGEDDYIRAVNEAAQADMNESNQGPEPDCDYISGRN